LRIGLNSRGESFVEPLLDEMGRVHGKGVSLEPAIGRFLIHGGRFAGQRAKGNRGQGSRATRRPPGSQIDFPSVPRTLQA
jgi:hypothetical protein